MKLMAEEARENNLILFYTPNFAGTALQTGRSRVRLPMESLEFFSDLILPVAL
jgi:hypothetical protein